MSNVLIMHSADGMSWTRVALFPSDWSFTKADDLYLEALKESQVGGDWNWDDIEASMVKRGFIATNWHVANYAWDEQATAVAEDEA